MAKCVAVRWWWIGAFCTLWASAAVTKAEPLRLLSEELSRDVFNHLVELDSLLKSGSWEEAAHLVSQLDTAHVRGVAPAPDDASLLLSLPVAIQRALRDYPRLVEHLEQDHGDLARLRIEQAIQGRKMRVVQQLAEQFSGTSASGQVLRWLGDQELAGGKAESAWRWYRQAEGAPGAVVDDSLVARLNLASALSGQGSEKAIHAAVQLGDVTMTPAELAELTAQLRARNPAPKAVAMSLFPATISVTGITTGVRHPLQLLVGKDPDKEVLPGIRTLRIDWTGRQLAATLRGGLLLVNNRFQLLALDEKSGASRWISQPLQEGMLRSQDWPLVPMVPLVHDGRIMARQLYGDAPQLACWDPSSGELLWICQMGEQSPVSDPFLLDQQLAVLALERQRSVDSVLQLMILDPRTGQTMRTYPLLRLRDSWWQRLVCQVTVSDHRFFAALGGVVFCSDSEGQVRWIRSSPLDTDPSWVAQHHQPPRLHGNQLILMQPGVRAIEALDPLTGVRQWQTAMPHVHQIVGCAEQRSDRRIRNGDFVT